MTFPDPREWLDDRGPFYGAPFVQRFDWGIPGPTTWLVAFEDEHGFQDSEEFATEAEAQAFAEKQAVVAKARGEQ